MSLPRCPHQYRHVAGHPERSFHSECDSHYRKILRFYLHFYLLVRKLDFEPTISKENNPAHLDSNTALIAEVHQGTVVYGSAWEVTGGDIQLSIEKSSGVYEGVVMIRYRDSQNIEAKIQNDLDDI